MRTIDSFLNSFTTYRVVLYGLIFLSCISIFFSGIGIVPFPTINLVISLVLILASCFISNFIYAKIFKVQVNVESFAITGLILFLILTPYELGNSPLNHILFATIAMGSKYVLAINKKHIFNPAAFALVVMGLFGAYEGEWWIGNTFLFPFVLLVGILIVRKVRKFTLFISYFIFAVISISLFAFLNGSEVINILSQAIPSWPLLFLGTIMLTEPITMPPKRRLQIIYGALVGFLTGVQLNIGPFFMTSETALILGNIFAYFVSFKKRLVLEFSEKIKLSPNIYEFVFKKSKSFNFLPGQYFEWTLGHHRPDFRGVRRYFTIASSPTEENLKLGVRVENLKGSSFKKSLLSLTPGQKIYAGSLSGDFTLPENKNEKLVFIAGGIGITPFRSMAKYMVDKEEKRDIVLFFSNSEPESFIYKDIFKNAQEFGLRLVPVLSKNFENWNGYSGRLNSEIIKKEVPEFTKRTYYLSGPVSMVESYKKLLSKLGIKPHKIVTDYFPGF
ncbi:MAG: oxidoreductase [Candidatus Levybacteria bacterium]|nr:oxidoreductase [Candidatus Levybacteria bacterium]